ncbi:MAG TPA: 3'(2'),5'-bisphosphate nucleotidase CysQ [Rhizomicrobium sp.]|jgi:3'(2'), 5'-bisphosphate nucleotidase|nr:3'(2'),5'-bisphosphate nucleotidase CysQ [Rhizomicrobium sp.]
MRSAPTGSAVRLAGIAWRAGEILLRHYAAETVGERQKADHSPVTDADEEAEALILEELLEFWPGVPVIAEEQAASGRVAEIGSHFFLVDPLDGTKEFLSRNGEFTVNIGEIVDGRPVRGVVFAPAKGRLFAGEEASGAFELGTEPGVPPDFARLRPIAARRAPQEGLVAVASRSHRDAATDAYLAGYPVSQFVSAGSSLKFCLVAAGEADIYPRLGRTMEWDTAAAHAVLAAAGGSVTTVDGKPFLYGKAGEKFANPFFVARGRD